MEDSSNICEPYCHIACVIRIYTAVKPYVCEHCSSNSFITQQELSIHSKSHSGEKLYTCEKCKKSFTTRQGLLDILKLIQERNHILVSIIVGDFSDSRI